MIKHNLLPLGILLASSAFSLVFYVGTGESLLLSLFVTLPAAAGVLWKTASKLSKDPRSVENWFYAVFLVSVALFLSFFALADIASFPFRK